MPVPDPKAAIAVLPRAAEVAAGIAIDLRELEAWGRALGQSIEEPLVVTLEGELGAGKTTLVRAICEGLGVNEGVTSPSYALIHEYGGARWPVYHMDLYRLSGPGDLTNLGYFDLLTSGGVVIIEWPERAGDQIPAGALRVELGHLPGEPNRRMLQVK